MLLKEILPPLLVGEGWGEGVKIKDVFDPLILACHLTGALRATKVVPDIFVSRREKEILE